MLAISRINRDAGPAHNPVLRFRQLAIGLLAAMMLAACAGSPTQESTGEYLDDTAITAKVKSKLLADEDVSGLAINVETFKGVVQLSGFAKTDEERQTAGRIAESVGGVEDVRNNIALK